LELRELQRLINDGDRNTYRVNYGTELWKSYGWGGTPLHWFCVLVFHIEQDLTQLTLLNMKYSISITESFRLLVFVWYRPLDVVDLRHLLVSSLRRNPGPARNRFLGARDSRDRICDPRIRSVQKFQDKSFPH